MEHPNQHGDMHAIVFHPTDPDYIMMGTDGGVYESFDRRDLAIHGKPAGDPVLQARSG